MLQIENLSSYYGSIAALKDINATVESGSICCIIGSNGAGKSTLLKSISGMLKTTGSIIWNGVQINKCSPRQITKMGIIHVPEGRHIFPGLTVEENLEVGTVPWRGFFGRKADQEDMDRVYEIFPRLKERRKQLGWSLSGGEQQMLAVGRALMARPSLLMLDEPSMGLAPIIVEELFQKILEINKTQGVPILLVEQNAMISLSVSDYAYVMDQGRIIIEGRSSELKDDSRVQEAYFGVLGNQQS